MSNPQLLTIDKRELEKFMENEPKPYYAEPEPEPLSVRLSFSPYYDLAAHLPSQQQHQQADISAESDWSIKSWMEETYSEELNEPVYSVAKNFSTEMLSLFDGYMNHRLERKPVHSHLDLPNYFERVPQVHTFPREKRVSFIESLKEASMFTGKCMGRRKRFY